MDHALRSQLTIDHGRLTLVRQSVFGDGGTHQSDSIIKEQLARRLAAGQNPTPQPFHK